MSNGDSIEGSGTMAKRIAVLATAAFVLGACAGSRTTLDLEGLGMPEQAAARALLGTPMVRDMFGDDVHVVSEDEMQLLDSGVPLLRDTRLPGTSREMRGSTFAVAGSKGKGTLEIDVVRRNNGRWRVDNWVARPADGGKTATAP